MLFTHFIIKDSKDEKRNVNEYDLIEIFNELLYKRTTVLIIEDLERDVELTGYC